MDLEKSMDLEPLNRPIIQGGMGVGVSDAPLAKEFSMNGQIGVVSGVAQEIVMTRKLQNGDPTGDIRRALEQFPDQEFAEWIKNTYYKEGGKEPDAKYTAVPFPSFKSNPDGSLSLKNETLTKLIVAANFVLVYLAKEGHTNPIGINYLYKVRYAMLPAIYGAMLAGVDAVMIGAGFAREIPNALKELKGHNAATIPIPVEGENNHSIQNYLFRFDPQEIFKKKDLKRPAFFGIISGHTGLKMLPNADAYVFEGPTAGGHNSPARNKLLNAKGEPDYGVLDEMKYANIRDWFEKDAQMTGAMKRWYEGGGFGSPEGFILAKEHGATGVQIGTLASLSNLSAYVRSLRLYIIEQIMRGGIVYTSPQFSSSGYPFKVFQSPESLSNPEVYNSRRRVCDLGFLVDLYLTAKGNIGTRCPSENVENYVRKGGQLIDTINKGCLCNGLPVNIGFGTPGELPIITMGSDLSSVRILVNKYGPDYTVKNSIDFILGKI